MIERESSVKMPIGDRRPEEAPGRDDQVSPYMRRGGESLGSATKGAYLGDSTGGSHAYRWTLALGGEPDMSKPYAQHPWVYACVSAIARSASSVPARLQRETPNGEYETVEQGPLAGLLNRPNPLMSQRKFFRSIATSQQLYGETFLIMLRRVNGRMVPVEAVSGSGMTAMIEQPEEIWPVRGDLVDAILDPETKLPREWALQTRNGMVRYPAHAVVQVAEVNPYNPLRGMGPMQAAYRTASKDFIIDRYDEALLQNGGSPGGVLSVDGPLTDADQRAIREAWNEAHSRADAHRKTAVLPQGTTYKEVGMTPQAMEHEKLRDWDRQTVLSIFGVPPVILGLETINYATAREQNRIFWDTTIMPYLDFLMDELQFKLISRLPGMESGLRMDFDISDVSAMREDMDSKVDRALKIYEKGHRTFAEAANLAGWDITEEELDGVDERYVPLNMGRIGGEGEVEAPQDPSEEPLDLEDDPDDEEARAVDPDRLDEVYSKWRSTVNMSASELESWSKNPCSRKASLNPTGVINRNLRLLRKKKSEWNSRDVRDANRTISFVSRMRGMPKGEPVTEGCPSKRDISLRNWAYNPDKGSRSYEGEERSWPEWLSGEEERETYYRQIISHQDSYLERVARRTKRVQRDMVLSARKRVREIANQTKEGAPTKIKAVFTEAEIQRLLEINLEEWGDELSDAIVPLLSGMMFEAAKILGGEIGVAGVISSVEHPIIAEFYANYPVYLAEGPQSTLAKEIHSTILDVMLSPGAPPASNLSQAIRQQLNQVESALTDVLGGLDARADRIAWTEVSKAYNGGRFEEMKQNNVKRHQWLSSRDAVVRETHAPNTGVDGEIVEVGQPFSNGVRFPGEGPPAPASEVVNCRCTTIAVRDTQEGSNV